MQKNWFNSLCIMKSLRSFFLLFLFPAFGFAQSLNGVYTGVLLNDSTTVRKDQSFEMALTEYRGKVFGYAYSTFIVNDTLYYIVKRVKGTVEGDICEVEDDEVISHNFPQKPEKKVFVSYTLRRNATDSIWNLDGNWKTNLTKKYYAISGKVETKEEKDLGKSKLYEHLGDLDLQKTLAFEKPKTPETKPTKPKEEKDAIAKNNVKKDDKKNTRSAETKSADKKPDASIAKNETKTPESKTSASQANELSTKNEKKDAVTVNNEVAVKKPDSSVVKTDPKTNSVVKNNPPVQNEKKDLPVSNPVVTDKKPENNIAKTETGLPDTKAVPATSNNTPVQNVNKSTVTTNTSPTDKKPEGAVVKTDNKVQDNKTVTTPANSQVNQPPKNDVVNVSTNNTDKKSEPATNKPDSKLVSVPVGYKPVQQPINTTTTDKKPDASVVKPDNKTTAANTQKDITQNKNDGFEFQDLKRDRKLKPAATLVDGRVTVPSETIFFKSDSISIAIYDNGEVDGDSVSVIINDEMFIEKQLLRSSAFRKTYNVPRGESDSLLVVLYADNLGKYPPNTGLLQIKDGDEIFYVRFRADLDRNAAIVLRRKSK
jgi:hypothetical protein